MASSVDAHLSILGAKASLGIIKDTWTRLAGKFEKAFTASMNMARSMIEDAARADIAASGNFGPEWTRGLHVTLDNMRIGMSHDISYAGIFETGGVIYGKPLLWIPLSGTDAKGTPASQYGSKLFSVNKKTGGRPLLFSVNDKLPKYFGIESVTMPKKWHLNEIQISVMSNFRAIFEKALQGTE